MELTTLCPCCSGKEYGSCCKPFHDGALPHTALLLMQARYSAYALNIPNFIIKTTHPASPQYSTNFFSWKRSISHFSKGSQFLKLEILDFKEKNSLATVTFTAHISQENRDTTFTERSYFEKIQNRWLYRGGQLAQGHAPNLVTTGQLRLLPLAYYGDPVLKTATAPITAISIDIHKLIDEMIETMDACNGIGLAAPQVHHSIRLFIIRIPRENDKGELEPGEVSVFINPKISLPSDETWVETEGCLSIPTIRAPVKRPKEITIESISLDGTAIKNRYSGWTARAIMHENDHLDGILFIDRISQEDRLGLAAHLQTLEKRIHDGKAL